MHLLSRHWDDSPEALGLEVEDEPSFKWLVMYKNILTFKRRVTILKQIVEMARVSFNELPYAGVEDGRDGHKKLLMFPQIFEACHYH